MPTLAVVVMVLGACKSSTTNAPTTADPAASFRSTYQNPGGMWMPGQMTGHAETLAKMGVSFDPAALTDPTAFPLGAVVSLGGYCSASFVSGEGLLVTNHHCATGILQSNSSTEANLLKEGYLAKTRADEKPGGRGGSVYVTQRVDDVSDTILDGIEAIEDPSERKGELDKRIEAAEKACEDGKPDVRCRVASFFEGARFFEIEQLAIRDVRLVYAPHAGVGVFGGEIDNWQWPRHTGDYTFLRAYVGPDGKPADFAEDNVPYKPPHHLEVSAAGLKQGDFVMVAGYPGRTSRLKTADEVREATDWSYPRRIARLDAMSKLLEAAAKDDAELAIATASMRRGIANSLTNSRGMLDGLSKDGLADRKAEEEAKLREWIAADEGRKAKYGGVLDEIAALNEEWRQHRDVDAAYSGVGRTMGTLQKALALSELLEAKSKKPEERDSGMSDEQIDKMLASLGGPGGPFPPEMERALVESTIVEAAALPKEKRPAFVTALVGKATEAEAVKAALAKSYEATALNGPDTAAFIGKLKFKKLKRNKDPFIKAALAYAPADEEISAREKAFDGAMAALRPKYIAALEEFVGAPVAPDANSTLRLSFGTVRGYTKPGASEPYVPFTKLSEMVAKHTGEEPFVVPQPVLDAAKTGNWGAWIDPRIGEVPVNFLADLDITGGNSGSATLNAKGQLVGLAFDGNYESMASDWLFVPEITRSIHVDIRYTLWLMDAVDGADHLIEEMGLSPSIQ
jgi:hypothetical protein